MTERKRERLGQLQIFFFFSWETNRELHRERPVIKRRSGGDDIADHRDPQLVIGDDIANHRATDRRWS